MCVCVCVCVCVQGCALIVDRLWVLYRNDAENFVVNKKWPLGNQVPLKKVFVFRKAYSYMRIILTERCIHVVMLTEEIHTCINHIPDLCTCDSPDRDRVHVFL
jgi:hypothetical protein